VNLRYADLERWPDAGAGIGNAKLLPPPPEAISRFQIKFSKIEDANSFVKLLERMMPVKWHDSRQETAANLNSKTPIFDEIVSTQRAGQALEPQTQVQTQTSQQEFASPFIFRAAVPPSRQTQTPVQAQVQPNHVYFSSTSQAAVNTVPSRIMGPPATPQATLRTAISNPVPTQPNDISQYMRTIPAGSQRELGSPFGQDAQTPSQIETSKALNSGQVSYDYGTWTGHKNLDGCPDTSTYGNRQFGLITPPGPNGKTQVGPPNILSTQDAMMTASSPFNREAGCIPQPAQQQPPNPVRSSQYQAQAKNIPSETTAQGQADDSLSAQSQMPAQAIGMTHDHWTKPPAVSISRRLLELEGDKQRELVREVLYEDGFIEFVEQIMVKGYFPNLTALAHQN